MAYDELAPFSIAGDQNLTMKALAESWVGNGSLGNPIIIEGYNITLDGAFGNCIALYNISLYLVIRDCIIGDGDTGIYLENVTRFSSFRNIIYTNNIGIKFDDCDHSSVIATSFTENNFHLQFVDNANMNIEDCQFESSVSAIECSQLFYSWFVNNTITNTDDGIVFSTACVGNVVRQNQFSKITIDGITLTNNAQLNKIVWNYFGGYMQGVLDNSIGLENEFSHNYYFGFMASDVNNDGIYDYSFLVPGTAGVSDANPLRYPPLPPSWAQIPQNFEMELGSACFYELQIDSYPPIETWLVNDTLNFEIDQNGNLLDRGNLKLGKYSLEVTAIDLYGQSISGEFTVTVTDT
ncbi:MAG: right-handed parallel beta-helix repeat-containing protein, partial [Candidatus Thorarchaeota archaeon]|nr:right-handed parallel beta-helix repeat-containing protein [Candidatus Thorarchaeota archaeon]